MNKRLLKRLFPVIAVLLLVPWPVAYGYEASDASAGQETIRVSAAEASAKPTWKAFGRAIGGVTGGDLFHIDATGSPADISVTLYLTNAEELIHSYRYLILEVGIQVKNGNGEWERASGHGDEPIPDTFITMRNGRVTFTLAGYANYKLTIDGGSFYAFTPSGDGNSYSPQFYLEVS